MFKIEISSKELGNSRSLEGVVEVGRGHFTVKTRYGSRTWKIDKPNHETDGRELFPPTFIRVQDSFDLSKTPRYALAIACQGQEIVTSFGGSDGHPGFEVYGLSVMSAVSEAGRIVILKSEPFGTLVLSPEEGQLLSDAVYYDGQQEPLSRLDHLRERPTTDTVQYGDHLVSTADAQRGHHLTCVLCGAQDPENGTLEQIICDPQGVDARNWFGRK